MCSKTFRDEEERTRSSYSEMKKKTIFQHDIGDARYTCLSADSLQQWRNVSAREKGGAKRLEWRKLYEASPRWPGWRFTAGRKFTLFTQRSFTPSQIKFETRTLAQIPFRYNLDLQFHVGNYEKCLVELERLVEECFVELERLVEEYGISENWFETLSNLGSKILW